MDALFFHGGDPVAALHDSFCENAPNGHFSGSGGRKVAGPGAGRRNPAKLPASARLLRCGAVDACHIVADAIAWMTLSKIGFSGQRLDFSAPRFSVKHCQIKKSVC